jgi:hypothetical protein
MRRRIRDPGKCLHIEIGISRSQVSAIEIGSQRIGVDVQDLTGFVGAGNR